MFCNSEKVIGQRKSFTIPLVRFNPLSALDTKNIVCRVKEPLEFVIK